MRPGAVGARPSAQVHDLRRRREEDPAAACAQRGAEVDVLGVEEVALVEQADALRIGARHEQARAADPVDERFAASSLRDPAPRSGLRPRRTAARRSSAAARRAARSSGRRTARRVRRSSTSRGPATAAAGCAASRATSASIAPGGTIVSLLSSSSSSPRRGANPGVRARGKPGVHALFARPAPRPALPHERGAAVGRRVVDDDDVVRSGGGAACSDSRQRARSAAALKLTMTIERVIGRAAFSIPASVRSAAVSQE